ncbi:cystathionine gamma-lyase [Plakobranchus ocellatus]|uniref:Cystathionine gamma-lyase n=1 Tax=Plakobranchus ocellatus TaxID=259542 RepID=A0AAV4CM18_9GAST|nr:cystathionine gamma-lyase [Plakobranchus ocellatus]
MKRHSETALEVARYLDQHPKVERVHYPGLESHPQHEVAKRQMTGGYSGVIMAEIKGGSKGGVTVAEVRDHSGRLQRCETIEEGCRVERL